MASATGIGCGAAFEVCVQERPHPVPPPVVRGLACRLLSILVTRVDPTPGHQHHGPYLTVSEGDGVDVVVRAGMPHVDGVLHDGHGLGDGGDVVEIHSDAEVSERKSKVCTNTGYVMQCLDHPGETHRWVGQREDGSINWATISALVLNLSDRCVAASGPLASESATAASV